MLMVAGFQPATSSPRRTIYVIASRRDEVELANQRTLMRGNGTVVVTADNRVQDIIGAALSLRARPNEIVVIPYTVCRAKLTPAERKSIEDAVRLLFHRGLKVFAASGDHGARCGLDNTGPVYPADVPGVCAVGALVHGAVPGWSGFRRRPNGTADPDGWDDGVLMRDGTMRLGTSIAVTRAAIRGVPARMRRDTGLAIQHNCISSERKEQSWNATDQRRFSSFWDWEAS